MKSKISNMLKVGVSALAVLGVMGCTVYGMDTDEAINENKDGYIKRLEEANQQLKDENDLSLRDLMDVREELSGINDYLIAIETKSKQLEEDKAKLEYTVELLKNGIGYWRNEYDKVNEKFTNAESQNKKLKKECQTYKTQLNEKKKEINSLSETENQLTNKLYLESNRVHELEQKLNATSTELAATLEKNQKLGNEYNSQNQKMHKKISELMQQNKQLRAQLDKIHNRNGGLSQTELEKPIYQRPKVKQTTNQHELLSKQNKVNVRCKHPGRARTPRRQVVENVKVDKQTLELERKRLTNRIRILKHELNELKNGNGYIPNLREMWQRKVKELNAAGKKLVELGAQKRWS